MTNQDNNEIQNIDQAACNANERSESTNITETILNGFETTAYYAVTIKNIKHKYFASENECIVQMKNLEKLHKAKIHDFTFELDSLGRNHIHAIMQARKGIRYNLYRKPYWHIDIKRLETPNDCYRWMAYMHKESEEIVKLLEYFTNGENHFVD